jgi:hypothetical protein
MKNRKLLIIAICAVAVVIAAAYFFALPDPDMVSHTQVARSGSGGQGESSWFGSGAMNWLRRALGGGSGDLTAGSDSPEYKALVDKIDRLYENFGMLSPDQRDEKKLLLDQAALTIDYQLGPNHPKKKEFLEIVGWSHDARQPLNKQFTSGDLDRKGLFKQLENHFKEVADKYASILTDEEYRKMFNMEKGESLAAAMGLTPEMAEALDTRDKTPPPDNLSADDYAISEEETMTPDQVSIFKKTYGDPAGYYPEPKEEEEPK